MRVPQAIHAALTESGLAWDIVPGGRHLKVRLVGRLVGILPRGKSPDGLRAEKNIVAQIRRAAKQLKGNH